MIKLYGVYDKVTRRRISPLFTEKQDVEEWVSDKEISLAHFEISFINTNPENKSLIEEIENKELVEEILVPRPKVSSELFLNDHRI